MADKIFDVLTRFNFESNDQELERANRLIGSQTNLIKEAEAQLERLDAARRKDGTNLTQIGKINSEYQQTNKLLDQLRGGYTGQIGIIATLQRKQEELRKSLISANNINDINRFNAELKNTTSELQKLTEGPGRGLIGQLSDGFKQGLGFAGAVGLAQGVAGAVGFVKDFAVESAKAAINFEQLQVSFSTLLGSESKANALLADLQKFAQETPFAFVQLTDLSKQLLAFGFAGEEIIPTLKLLGDVSAGLGQDKLPNIVYAFGQIRANGKLMGQDLLQLINAGFNPLQIISEKTGKSMTALRKEMELGKITFKDVEGAFKTATSAGGRFFNLMQNQSKTTAGAISNMGDAVEQLKISIGTSETGVIKSFVTGLTNIVNKTKEFIELNPSEKIRQEQFELNSLVEAIRDQNTDNETRLLLIEKLHQKYPDFLGDLAQEEITTGLITKRLEDVNAQYEARLKLIDKVAVTEGLLAIRQKQESGKVEAAIIRGALKNVGIDKNLSQVTAEDINNLTGEEQKSLINVLKQLDFISKIDIARKRLGTNNTDIKFDPSLFLNAIKRADELEAKAKESTKSVDEALKTAFKEQEKAQADADPLKILEKQLEGYTTRAQVLRGLIGVQTGNAKRDLQKELKENEDIIHILTLQIAKIKAIGKPAPDDDNNAAAQKLADKRIDFETKLTEKLAKLQGDRDKILAQTETKSSESIRRAINAERDKDLAELDALVSQATKKKLLTEKSELLISQIRKFIKDNADLEFLKENKAFLDKLKKQQDEFNLQLAQIELQAAADRLKLSRRNINDRLKLIQDETAAALDAINRKFDNLNASAIDLGLDPAQVERDRQNALDIRRTQGKQKALDAEISFMEESSQILQKGLDLQLSQINEGAAKETAAQDAKYRKGKIAETNYQIAIAKIKRDAELAAIEAERKSVADQLLQQEKELARLEKAQKEGDGFVSEQQVLETKTRISKLKTELAGLDSAAAKVRQTYREAVVAAVTAEISQYNDLIQKAGAAAQAIIQIELDKNQRLIDAQQKRVDAAKEIADKGGAEVLKKEQDRLQKLTEAQEKHAREVRAINAIMVISQNALNVAQAVGAVVNAAQGDPYTVALRVAAAVIAVAAGVAASVAAVNAVNVDNGGFFDGGYTGKGDPKQRAGDVHKEEYVFDHKATRRIGVKTLERLRNGEIQTFNVGKDTFMIDRQVNYSQMIRDADNVRSYSYQQTMDTRKIEKRLDRVVDAIQGLPGVNVALNEHGFALSVAGAISQMEKMKRL